MKLKIANNLQTPKDDAIINCLIAASGDLLVYYINANDAHNKTIQNILSFQAAITDRTLWPEGMQFDGSSFYYM